MVFLWLMTSQVIQTWHPWPASPVVSPPRSTDQDFQQCGRRRRVPSPLHGTSQSTLSYLESMICWDMLGDFFWEPRLILLIWIDLEETYQQGLCYIRNSKGFWWFDDLKRWSWSQAITSNFPLFEVFHLLGYPKNLQVTQHLRSSRSNLARKCPPQDGNIHGPGMGLWLITLW